MNLGDLWAGQDYAWYHQKGRGEVFRWNARRVKIIRVYKKRLSGNYRETGFAEVMMLEEDGTPKEAHDGTHITREVRARDIAMRWEQYADEKEHRQVIREKEEREYQERMARIEAERLEKERLENESKDRLRELLIDKYGLPEEVIGTISSTHIYLHRSLLEKELGVMHQ